MSFLSNFCSANSPRRQSHDQSNRQPVGFLGNSPSFLRLICLDSLDLAYNAISREIHSTLDTIVVMPVRYDTSSIHLPHRLRQTIFSFRSWWCTPLCYSGHTRRNTPPHSGCSRGIIVHLIGFEE